VEVVREWHERPYSFVGENYDMDVKVLVGLHFSGTKMKAEFETEDLRALLKTPRQIELYQRVQELAKGGA